MNNLIPKVIIALCITVFAAASTLKPEQRTIELTTTNTVVFRGAVTNQSAQDIALKVFAKHYSRESINEPIYLVLDSPGGSITAGNNLIEFLKTIPNLHTITIFAASMAHGIAQALPGKRYIANHGIMMAHRASVRMGGQINDGEFESRLKMIKEIVERMERRNASRIGISIEKYRQRVKDEWWTTSSSCKKENHCDAVVAIKCSPDLVKSRVSGIINSMFSSKEVKFSGCPLIRDSVKK